MRRQQLSIRNILLLTVGSLTLLIALLVLREIYTQWQRLAGIESLKEATLLSDQLFDATEKLSEERDVSYSMMYATDKATIDSLTPQLKDSRRQADETLRTTLQTVKAYDFSEIDDQLKKTEKQISDLRELRRQIDKAVAQPPQARDHALSERWFTQATATILQTQDLWMKFMKHFADIDPIVTLHMRFKHFLGVIVEYSGRERSLIGRLLVENTDPTPQEQAQLLQWEGAVDLGWNISAIIADQGELAPAISPYFNDAKSHYFTIYDMTRDIFYTPRTQHHGTSYPITVDFWLELATQATDSLYALKTEALKQARGYMDALEAKARRKIVADMLLLLSAIVLCFYSFRTISRRVIFPIHGMISALISATEGKPVSLAPLFQNRQDEIGQLAHVLHVFQKNAEEVKNAQKANALLAAIVESSDDAILSKSPDGIISSWNLGAEHLFGYSAAEAIGQPIDLIIPPHRGGEEGHITALLNEGKYVEHYETVRKHKNGKDIDVSLTVSLIRDASGKVIGASKIIHNITARKEAERKIQESQERYRALVGASSQVIWIWKEGALEEMSPLWEWWETTTGQPAGDIATFGWLEVVHPDDRDRVKKIWESALAEHKNFEMDYRLRSRDGHYVHVEVRGVALLAADGSVREFVGSLNDVTERKEAEQEIKDGAARLKTVFDTVLDGLITINSKAIIQSFNASAERIFGYKAEEVIGQNVKMLMPEPYHGEHDSYVGNYLATGKAKIIGIGREVTAKRKDGSVFPMELGINAFNIGNEKAFVGMIRDITARKEAEAEQRQADLARQISENKLRAVVDHALDGLITIDARGNVESFNPACERIFGYRADEVVGCNIKILMPEPYHSEHDGYLSRYRETGVAKIIGTAGREVSAKRKDGSVFPMDLSISAFELEDGKHFSGIIRDITMRKEAETKLLHYTNALELSNKELDDFAYIASHDLKEPLRGLHNHSRFLLEDNQDKLDADSVSRLNRLSYLSQRMERLVNDLLYFSRLGRQELAIQATDINEVIRDIESTLDVFLNERHARITVPKALPTVTCDKLRVTEAFRNLITNAIKYNDSPEKIVEIGFLATHEAPKGKALKDVFYVKDTGRGIESGFYDEIFRIFKRLQSDKDSPEEGTGVGLTFVKKIVERHAGKIWLESEPGKGTTFYFTLSGE